MTVSFADMQMGKALDLKAHYDAAKTTHENAAHWSFSSALSADRINSRQTRTTLRNRARYEIANNCYAEGIVSFIAQEVVGDDLHLMLRDPSIPRDDAKWAEGEIHDWLSAVGLVDKLSLLSFAQVGDGESFGIMSTNPALDVPVRLDLQTYECDHVQNPAWAEMFTDGRNVDGVVLDQYGNPITYNFLRNHPGGCISGILDKPVPVPASQVIHLFRPRRPGQHRGVSEIASALPLFAMLRRYTLAVLAAAETAADIAGVLHSSAGDVETADKAEAFERIEIERRALMTIPEGYDLRQFKAEQPTGTYAEFKRECVAEIARCVSVPVGVALGDHSGFNYSSAKLDGQLWQKSRQHRRNLLRRQALDKLLGAWRREALLIPGYIPQSLQSPSAWAHDWMQSGDQFADPHKEGSGQKMRLESSTTNLAIECAREGRDWEEVLTQRARELAVMRELGMAPAAGGDDVLEDDDDD